MKQKIQRILNIIMGSFIGVFIGSGLYRYWHFRKGRYFSSKLVYLMTGIYA